MTIVRHSAWPCPKGTADNSEEENNSHSGHRDISIYGQEVLRSSFQEYEFCLQRNSNKNDMKWDRLEQEPNSPRYPKTSL